MYEEKFETIDMLQAQKLVEQGLSDTFIARFFCVTLKTWNSWKRNNTDFAKNYECWKAVADNKVQKALFKRATGFTHIEQEKSDKGVVINERKTFYPPSDAAIKMWLTNRMPDEWQDKKVNENKNDTKVEARVKVQEIDSKERIKLLMKTEKEDDLEDALQ